jgi:hypothetical protein
MAPLDTANASPIAGTTGLMASRAAIVAKKAKVHAPNTAPWYDHSLTPARHLERNYDEFRSTVRPFPKPVWKQL